MHPHHVTVLFTALTLCLAHAASAQVPHMKATAPERMLPSDKGSKMRECEKQAEQQKIKMEDRSRFVNECVAARAK